MQAHSLLSMDPYTLSLGQTRLILVQYNLGFFALNPRTFIYSFIFLNFFCLYLLSIIIFYFTFTFFFLLFNHLIPFYLVSLPFSRFSLPFKLQML